MKGLPYDAEKIGQCYSCLRDECVNPKFLKNNPNWGCRDWTTPRARKLVESLLLWGELSQGQDIDIQLSLF